MDQQQCLGLPGEAEGLSARPLNGDPDPRSYDRVVVALSGGKDSVACALYLLEMGVARSRIELWHHLIDGREGGAFQMDWPFTEGYCRGFAAAFGLPIYFSWKRGGFAGEAFRKDAPTAPTAWEDPGGAAGIGGGRGPRNTRMRFPQVSADLSVRWCSGYLKVMVAEMVIRASGRFGGARTLFVTGERAEESPARNRYRRFEIHRADARSSSVARHVDGWRPIHAWREAEVWDILRRHRVRPAPPYRLGWSRLSCACCIFGNADQWASVRAVAPGMFARVAAAEAAFGSTIDRRRGLEELAGAGRPYAAIAADPAAAAEAMDPGWAGEVLVPDGQEWAMPAGAFGRGPGPS